MGEKFKATGRKAMSDFQDLALALVFGMGMMLIGSVIIFVMRDDE